jgi:hypothetical protein
MEERFRDIASPLHIMLEREKIFIDKTHIRTYGFIEKQDYALYKKRVVRRKDIEKRGMLNQDMPRAKIHDV